MLLEDRINVLVKLGKHLLGEDEFLQAIMHRTHFNNKWFTIENQQMAVRAIAENMLDEGKLRAWINSYLFSEAQPLTVGMVMAGNIPLVGFHDILCVFVSGHKAMIKLSDKDQYLLPYLIKLMIRFDARCEAYFEIVPQLNRFDAVIATGSNNSARYFEAYFGKYPHIIRKNRNGVAVLTGEENPAERKALGKDVFHYYGLGCRNVAKLYLPRDYEFEPLLESLHEYNQIVLNEKYKNNFDYNYALYVLNKAVFKANGSIILTEDASFQSRIAGLHYEFYDSLEEVEKELVSRAEEIQCIVAKPDLFTSVDVIPFGQTQEPGLADYADGVDTLAFLLGLSNH